MVLPIQPILPLSARLATPAAEGLLPPIQRRRRRRRKRQDLTLTPREESLLSKGVGAVQYLGETLDKPGAALRGLLAGEPEQLLNLVPFSDYFGWTDPKTRVSGHELGRMAGLWGKNKPGFDRTDVGAFALEVALDPLVWVTGPLGTYAKASKLGKAAAGGGKAAKGIKPIKEAAEEFAKATAADAYKTRVTSPFLGHAVAEEFRAGGRAAMGIQAPWPFSKLLGKEPLMTFGQGAMARAIHAPAAAAWAVDKAFYSRLSPVRWYRWLMSPTAGGGASRATWTAAHQKAADIAAAQRLAMKGAVHNLTPSLRAAEASLHGQVRQILKTHGRPDSLWSPETAKAFERELLEVTGGLPEANEILGRLGKRLELGDLAGIDSPTEMARLGQTYHEFLGTLQQMKDKAYSWLHGLGAGGDILQDILAHFPRVAAPAIRMLSKVKRAAKGRTGGVPYDMRVGRKEILTELPSGVINDMSTDRLLTATTKASRKELAKGLRARLDELGIERFTMVKKEGVEKLVKKQDNLLTMQAKVALHDYIEPALHKFRADDVLDDAGLAKALQRWREPVPETVRRGGKMVTDMQTAKYSRAERLVGHLRELPEEVLQSGYYPQSPVDDVLQYLHGAAEIGDLFNTVRNFASSPGVLRLAGEGAEGVLLSKAWKQAGFHKDGLEGLVRQAFPEEVIGKYADIGDFIADVNVRADAVGTLKAYRDLLRPRVQGEIAKTVDSWNALWKNYLFVPFPSSHARNAYSATWKSWSHGHVGMMGKDGLAATTARAARYVLSGGQKGKLAVLDVIDPKELYGMRGQMEDIATTLAGETEAITGTLADILEPLGRLRPIAGKKQRDVAGGWWKGVFSPASARGWREVTPEMARAGVKNVPQNVPLAMGTATYAAVERTVRFAYAEALHAKGFEPGQIIELVKRAQFDYSEISVFHAKFLKRASLFPTFTSKNVPDLLVSLFERPGGRVWQTARAAGHLAKGISEETMPGFLGETLAVPMGGEPEARHVMMQSGIPLEELNKFILGGHRMGGWFPWQAIKRTTGKFASLLHPVPVSAAEQLAGQQFYTGRPLDELWSPTEHYLGKIREHWPGAGEYLPGKMPIVDRLAHVWPGSRIGSTGLKWLHPGKPVLAKAADFFTGTRIGTYDVPRALRREQQRVVRDILSSDPLAREFTVPYIPERYKDIASRELLDLIALERKLPKISKAEAAKRSKKAKKR